MYRTNLTFSIFSTDNSRWWSARQSWCRRPAPTITMDESRAGLHAAQDLLEPGHETVDGLHSCGVLRGPRDRRRVRRDAHVYGQDVVLVATPCAFPRTCLAMWTVCLRVDLVAAAWIESRPPACQRLPGRCGVLEA